MAYDEDLAARYRSALDGKTGITEKRMMGGICFFLNDHMIGGADRDRKTDTGRFMFRVGKDNQQAALSYRGTYPVAFGGRQAGGLVFLDEKDLSPATVKALLKMALSFAASLPPKPAKAKARGRK